MAEEKRKLGCLGYLILFLWVYVAAVTTGVFVLLYCQSGFTSAVLTAACSISFLSFVEAFILWFSTPIGSIPTSLYEWWTVLLRFNLLGPYYTFTNTRPKCSWNRKGE